jgi:GMP synthase-like glutamine amidotransferase
VVLAIVHEPDAGPGVFADAIRDAGGSLEEWLITNGGQPPRDVADYDAVITLGGAMHPDQEDRHPWITREKSMLAELIAKRVPLLGVCLGAELVAAAAGAAVDRAERPEIGWRRVRTTDVAAGDPLLASLAPEFDALEWHSYAFELPPGGVALASSATCLQAFRVGDLAWGIQFHAEVRLEDFEAWVDHLREDEDAVALGIEPEHLRSQTRAAIAGWNRLGRDLCARFLAAVP